VSGTIFDISALIRRLSRNLASYACDYLINIRFKILYRLTFVFLCHIWICC